MSVALFAVTMIEVYTFAERPYKNMENGKVIREVTAGYRLPRPPGCGVAAYALIARCWAAEPSERPSFAEVCGALARLEAAGEEGLEHLVVARADWKRLRFAAV